MTTSALNRETALAGMPRIVTENVSVVITTLTLAITILGVPANAVSLFKALVVIVVCLLQSPKVRNSSWGRRRPSASVPAPVEVPA